MSRNDYVALHFKIQNLNQNQNHNHMNWMELGRIFCRMMNHCNLKHPMSDGIASRVRRRYFRPRIIMRIRLEDRNSKRFNRQTSSSVSL